MKNEKLRIEELKVNSFITNLSGKEKNTLNGAAMVPGITDNAITCALSQIKHICLPIETTEVTISLNKISITIVNSNRNTDCTGATRIRCNATGKTSPCDSMC